MDNYTRLPSRSTWAEDLIRLELLRQSDSGLYAVALHAFIEGYIQNYVNGTYDMNFPEIIKTWWREHLEQNDDLMSVLASIIREHSLTNNVRHRFIKLSGEETRTLTWNFLRLGTYIGWSEIKEAEPLRKSLMNWDERKPAINDKKTADYRKSFRELQKKSDSVIFLRREMERKEIEILNLKKNLLETENGINGLYNILSPVNTEILKKRNRILSEIRDLRKEIDNSDYKKYIEGLSRFTRTARTRRDFEKHLVNLTPEQREALENFSVEKDVLITGGAGTGKTLILLKALSEELKEKNPELNMGQPKDTALITYTKTLLKYERYLSGLMKIKTDSAVIESSETFFWKKLKIKEPEHTVDYYFLENIIPEINNRKTLSDKELWLEIEEFLFGNNISRDEYIDSAVPRQGLKTPLNQIEREEIWEIRDRLVSIMIRKGIYSKHFARIRLLEWTKKEPEVLRTHETLFVDESQDLSAVEIMCLKNLRSRSLVLAGDTGQSIYGFINPYIRAGLKLKQDQIILLKTNHRNTIPIHNLAEKYRKKTAEVFEDQGTESYPFREGPDPEVHIHNNPEYLAELLAIKTQIYVSDLGYDPESIGILCSRTGHFGLIRSAVEKRGLKTTVIKNPDFMFSEPGIVRLSTLHSSKGLDFPVVLIFLPESPPAKELEKNYRKRLYRNLIYVAMSRAMDILDIYTTEDFADNFI